LKVPLSSTDLSTTTLEALLIHSDITILMTSKGLLYRTLLFLFRKHKAVRFFCKNESVNLITQTAQCQAASRNVSTGQNFLFRLTADSPLFEACLIKREHIVHRACVSVLQTCDTRNLVSESFSHRSFDKLTFFLSQRFRCGLHKFIFFETVIFATFFMQ